MNSRNHRAGNPILLCRVVILRVTNSPYQGLSCIYIWSMKILWGSTALFALVIKPLHLEKRHLYARYSRVNKMHISLHSVIFCVSHVDTFFCSTQLSARPSILWTGQRSGATLSPSSGSLGTIMFRRRCTASRSPAPSGTPTNRSRDSCGLSTRTSVKVGHTQGMIFIKNGA